MRCCISRRGIVCRQGRGWLVFAGLRRRVGVGVVEAGHCEGAVEINDFGAGGL